MSTLSNFDFKRSESDPKYAQEVYFETIDGKHNCQSELVFRLGVGLFAGGNRHLEANQYQHLHRLLEAASELQNMSVSSRVLHALNRQFQRDPEILRHYILTLYKLGADTHGDSMLKGLLAGDLQNRALQHTGLAYYKKNMLETEYVEELAKYLAKNFTDRAAWVELGNLYEKNLDFERATHCYEEVLLLRPNDLRVFVKLGQLLFTQGSQPKLEIAKKYFCHVLTQRPDDLRALHGLRNVLQFTAKSAHEKKNLQVRKLGKLVDAKLKELDPF